MNNIFTPFKKIFKRSNAVISGGFSVWGNWIESRLDFGNCIFLNIIDLLTDLTNDVTLINKRGDSILFSEFKFFFESWGKVVLNKLFYEGYVVIGKDAIGFRILEPSEYMIMSADKVNLAVPVNPNIQIYVMRSQSFVETSNSDRQLLLPYIKFLNNVLNGSNTVSSRLGSLIAGTPKQPPQNPVTETLDEESRKELENDISKNYGSLANQKQFLLFNRPLDLTKISLAEGDKNTFEKVKLCVLAIADRIKVPANQIAIIDAMSAKTLSNGSELREGDFNKYQSFERLLNQTFVTMAITMGLSVDYKIYNKPQRVTLSL